MAVHFVAMAVWCIDVAVVGGLVLLVVGGCGCVVGGRGSTAG